MYIGNTFFVNTSIYKRDINFTYLHCQKFLEGYLMILWQVLKIEACAVS